MTFITTSVGVLLLDIEGTTTPIDFVYNILFPYAREHVRAYLQAHLTSTELQAEIRELLQENSDDAGRGLDPPLIDGTNEQFSVDEIVAYVNWLMDRDRKSTPLKSIQGRIWQEGYGKGDLRSQIFEDVAPAFKRWRDRLKEICIYSSGSVLAQKLLFAHTDAGDLAILISNYFDTKIGAKQDPASYRRIAVALDREPSDIMFVSDRAVELDAAADAGFEVVLCSRPGNEPQPSSLTRGVVETFDEIFP